MDRLFEPVRLGPLTLKNRLVMTAMSTRFAGPRGEVTERLMEYYAARAAGGTGLITVEEAFIHPQLPHVKNALGIYGDHLIPGLQALTRRLQGEGARACLQIGHYFRPQITGFPRYAASLQAPDCGPGCRELTVAEIHYLTGLFTDAAQRAKNAGFDAVEVHACHGCLISEFLSPFWNRRTDRYGGDRDGRFRFALEILQAIRGRLGSDYPVLFRISGSEFTPDGFAPVDAVALSRSLEEAGVTAVSVSGGLGHVNHIAIPPCDVPRGILLPVGRAIKEAVRVPVIVGNSMTPELAAKAVACGQTDLIGLGRPLIADPQWPEKVREGRLHEIRHCLRCNQGCFGALRDPSRKWIGCMYNPLAGREFEHPITPAVRVKKVVVIGGGPAGCETARVARLRGHDVVLLEKGGTLGGQFCLAALPPEKGDFRRMADFYGMELPRLGVEVHLGTEVTAATFDSLPADVYVLATGSRPSRPPIPGANLPHVHTAHEILHGSAPIGKGAVVVVGGGASGLETADFLSEKGLTVTVVEMLDTPGRDIIPGIGIREALLSRLCARGVQVLTGHRVVGIEADGVRISDRPLIGGGKEISLAAEAVVLSLGMKPDDAISQDAFPAGAEVYRVGDCRTPGNALDAIHQAFELALKI